VPTQGARSKTFSRRLIVAGHVRCAHGLVQGANAGNTRSETIKRQRDAGEHSHHRYVLKFNTGYLAKCRTLGAGNGLSFFNNERIFLGSVPSLSWQLIGFNIGKLTTVFCSGQPGGKGQAPAQEPDAFDQKLAAHGRH
jgi:hypothetical protein